MTMKTSTFTDKSAWPRGPWDGEPDKAQWIDEATDLDCLAVRSDVTGAWCGYVGIAESHPLFGRRYQRTRFDVHGGLTFSGRCQEGNPEGVCHVPLPGRPAVIWWFGFDCAHAYDITPAMLSRFAHPDRYLQDEMAYGANYRSLEYVRSQCEGLAAQIARSRAWDLVAP